KGQAMHRAFFAIILAAVTISGMPLAAGSDLYDAVHGILEKSDGKLTPELRQAYLDWSEKTALETLAAGKQSIPDDCLKEIHARANLRDAMFGAIYPPDPSIVQNYARLRESLGPAFMQRYRSLVVGVAVTQRKKEAEEFDPNDPDTVPDAGNEDQGP